VKAIRVARSVPSARRPAADGVLDESDSRAATDELMRALRANGYTPAAWSQFLVRAIRRSVRQAVVHRRALIESSVLHAGLGVVADPRYRAWVAVSWLFTVSHLGMLERRDTLRAASGLLADTAVWTWFTLRHEHNRWLRAATFAAWGSTVVAVTVASFAGGAMRDIPRSRWIRPAAALQVIIAARIVFTRRTRS